MKHLNYMLQALDRHWMVTFQQKVVHGKKKKNKTGLSMNKPQI